MDSESLENKNGLGLDGYALRIGIFIEQMLYD